MRKTVAQERQAILRSFNSVPSTWIGHVRRASSHMQAAAWVSSGWCHRIAEPSQDGRPRQGIGAMLQLRFNPGHNS